MLFSHCEVSGRIVNMVLYALPQKEKERKKNWKLLLSKPDNAFHF